MIKTGIAQQPARVERTPPAGVTWHPYADIFPWIEGPAFEELKADIAKNGVLEPIVFLDGAVLDGRNRYMAARDLGIEYPRVEYTGDDPLGFVISHNLKRRHLSESQRAMVAAKLAKMPQGARTDIAQISAMSQPRAAEMLNVSRASVQTAKQVQEHGAPELVAAVESGKVSVSAAAEVATKLPKEQQAEAVAKGTVKDEAKASRAAKKASNAAFRDAAQAALPDTVKATASKSTEPTNDIMDALAEAQDRIAELQEANAALEKEVAVLTVKIKLFSEMEAEWKKGGFGEVIAGKEAVIAAQASRIERESGDKVSWKRAADMWRKRAEEAGWTNDVLIEIEGANNG